MLFKFLDNVFTVVGLFFISILTLIGITFAVTYIPVITGIIVTVIVLAWANNYIQSWLKPHKLPKFLQAKNPILRDMQKQLLIGFKKSSR
ncbi:hypothetical protein F9874_06250 [Glaesserella parasuis]|uniref:hypothetical protein n=1 Tax=Glaesserella parasuis TaxID=738 RepID=UPI00094FB759|nr:hypothetical protein [Glaesserella parasuis]MDG6267923.1 hypothetical protein [Glaesserella parasuis]MDO9758758.1 hypothetical protein [Glaesserella parasuis]MDP0266430.1 hypothetical protein [Glaesserella parasuis]MWQ04039.1 hypothetical protein [Glaesserella parasuis]MWQ39196.1 hypothetical protein [Glaesserella parasuis]